MSPRNPDYEALRELQARSQEADRIGPEPYEVPCDCGADSCTDTIDPTDDYEGDDW
jgi:hypothetical protein